MTSIRVMKSAHYRGFDVFLERRDDQYYSAVYDGMTYPEDLLIDMHSGAKGEYRGKIPIDDPELKIED